MCEIHNVRTPVYGRGPHKNHRKAIALLVFISVSDDNVHLITSRGFAKRTILGSCFLVCIFLIFRLVGTKSTVTGKRKVSISGPNPEFRPPSFGKEAIILCLASSSIELRSRCWRLRNRSFLIFVHPQSVVIKNGSNHQDGRLTSLKSRGMQGAVGNCLLLLN